MDIIGTFHLDWRMFAAQLFNFLVIGLLLWQFIVAGGPG